MIIDCAAAKVHPFTQRLVIMFLLLTGKMVFLVSGGFHQMIEPIAAAINVPSHRIFANKILFDKDGNFHR